MAYPSLSRYRRIDPAKRRPPIGWLLFGLPQLAFIAIPLLALFLRVSPDSIWEHLQQPQVLQAIALSLRTTIASTLIILTAGTPLAYLLARYDFPLHNLADTLVDLPTVLPPAVAGVSLLMAFGRRGVIGSWLNELGITITFTTLAVVIAQVFIAAPFYIRAAAIGFANLDIELEQSAALDGAGPWQVLRYITLPLARTALLGGAVLAWARALGEFGATIIFAGNFPGRTQTMPLAIYIGFEFDLDVALTLSIILVGVSTLVLLLLRSALGAPKEIS